MFAGIDHTRIVHYAWRQVSQTPPWLMSLLLHAIPLGMLSFVAMNAPAASNSIATIDTRIDDEAINDAFTQQLEDFKALPENVTYLAYSGSTAVSGGGGGGSGGTAGGGGGGLGSGTGGLGRSAGTGIPVDPGRASAVRVPSYLVGLGGGGGLPGKLSMDRPLGLGSGGLKGEVDAHADDTAAAMDRITREILRFLQSKKVLVIWLFDESLSMRDDQDEVKQRLDRVYEELGITRPDAGDAVETVVCSFGKQTHFLMDKPTHELAKIRSAIEKIPLDETGIENTSQAVKDVLGKYHQFFAPGGRWIVFCLVTDESGDDGVKIEEALQIARQYKTPVYLLGRQAMFGKRKAILTWVNPDNGAVYHPTIDRGPESADVELLQFDGLHHRYDNQVSGFGPYELARLARDSGGIYFILPGEEEYGLGKAKAYDYLDLKQYVPEYISRREYFERRQGSDFRRTLYQIIDETRPEKIAVSGYISAVEPPKVVEQARAADLKAQAALQILGNVDQTLIRMRPLRDKEASRRWQADYDLIAGQVPAYEVMLIEFRLMMQELMKNPPVPAKPKDPKFPPVGWWVGHGDTRRINSSKDKKLVDSVRSKEETARSLLAKVVEEHPKTPWADRAQWELSRGWGATFTQHNRDPWYYAPSSRPIPNF